MKLMVNGTSVEVATPPATPLLWVLREEVGLTGTKFGCGIAVCGACTVHIDGAPRRSCVTDVGSCADHSITTIEGMAGKDGALHPLQQAWIDENVPQCGYCQSGQIMSAAALLAARPNPTEEEVDAVMSANLCRCGTYPRIRLAVLRAAAVLRGQTTSTPAAGVTTGGAK
jgi:isoquinoline 1-oxidoreductase subunit alpha